MSKRMVVAIGWVLFFIFVVVSVYAYMSDRDHILTEFRKSYPHSSVEPDFISYYTTSYFLVDIVGGIVLFIVSAFVVQIKPLMNK